jgi:hypothetical protein
MSIEDLEFANGKSFVENQRDLESLLGIDKISPFGTYELEVFEENLKGATHADLQKIAQRVGLNPFIERSRLKTALIREFTVYTKNARRNTVPQPAKVIKLDPKNPQHAETLRLIS